MKTNQIQKTVENCTSCGWNHAEVEFKRDAYNGHFFDCPLSKDRVKFTPDVLQTIIAILGKGVN